MDLISSRYTFRIALVWALVVCLIIGHNAYLWLGKRIAPNTDIMALLPLQKRDPVMQQAFTHMVDAAQQRVIVLVSAKDWAVARKAATAYREMLLTQPQLLSNATVDEQAQQDWLAVFQQHHLNLITTEQEGKLQNLPTSYWVDTALRQVYNPFSGPKSGAWRDDPFGLFSAWVEERAQETPVRPHDGYLYVDRDERHYILLSMTIHDSVFAMSTQQAVVSLLDKARSKAIAAGADVDIISAGVILHAAAAGQQASGEVWTIGLGSMLGIILLMWAAFHSLKPILFILLSIVIGCLGSLSVCWLLFGQIHLLTLVFGASLIGVAQDYGIFFLCHRLNAGEEVSSRLLLRRLLPSLTLTLLAAVIGYLGLAFTPFPGLRSMAVFSALGLIFAWLTVLCWFPLLVGHASLKSGKLVRWYEGTLIRWPLLGVNRKSGLVFVAIVLLAASGWVQLKSNDDIRLLQNSPPHLIADQIKLSQILDAPTPVQFYLVRATTLQGVLEREELLKQRLNPWVAQHKITGYQAISNWVPSQNTQQRRRQLVEDRLLRDGTALTQIAEQIGEEGDWVVKTREHLQQFAEPLTVSQFLASPSSEPWRFLWLGDVDGGYASIVALRGLLPADLATVQHAGDDVPGVQWVDKVAEISSVLGQYRVTMGWVLVCAYMIIFGMLFIRYRRDTWRILAPTVIASGLALAVLGVWHQPIQLFHVLAFMLLLGIGVDYGIFMQENATTRLTTAWLAIGLSAVNTLLSFGLLGLSQTPALHAFGLTLLIGVALVWFIVPLFRKENNGNH